MSAAARASSPPTAADATSRETARAHYARGLALAAQNGYEAALREFTEAYAISPQFAVLYNIGQAHVALGHPVEAIAALSKYLRDGRDHLPPGRREQVQAQIASLVSALDLSPPQDTNAPAPPNDEPAKPVDPLRVAAIEESRLVVRPTTLAVRCPEPGVKIAVDGKPVDLPSASRGVPVAPGAHRLALATSGRRPAEQTLDVAPGSASVVLCPFLPPPAAGTERRGSFDGPPVFTGAPPPPPQAVEVHASTVGVALSVAGLALGGGALGLYLWNRGQVQQADSERAYLTSHPNAVDHFESVLSYNERADSIQRTTAFTIGLAVAGGAALAGGIYLWRRGHVREHPAEPARSSPEGGLAIRATPGSAALSWDGSW